jgi:hypothetical protein
MVNELMQRKDAKEAVRGDIALWTAVIEEALKCLAGMVIGVTGRTAKVREIERARDWFLSDETLVGTFLWVCTQLDMDGVAIRRNLYDRGLL